jgi:hypothetical protein
MERIRGGHPLLLLLLLLLGLLLGLGLAAMPEKDTAESPRDGFAQGV